MKSSEASRKRAALFPVVQALLAAGLFGASAPFAKLLLGEIQPIPLAALLYLGSGIGMLLMRRLRGINAGGSETEARITRSDIPWLTGAVLVGGVAAPIVLLFSLRNTPAATASLLLNFEGVATTLMAALVFKEAIGRRVWLAIGCVASASVLLSWQSGGDWGISLGALGILGACVLWGLDNNLTSHISAKDPTAIVMVKGLAAGTFSLLLAVVTGSPLPGLATVAGGLILGFVSYGLSIMLFVRAMRGLGAARTSALFGAAPFVGAAFSFVLYRESPGVLALIALPFMVAGTVLLIGEGHGHSHHHRELIHEHRHTHEEGHHLHDHAGEDIGHEHSHMHRHPAQDHTHPHTPDIHHRHEHPGAE